MTTRWPRSEKKLSASISAVLTHAREDAGLSQGQLAHRLRWSQSQVCRVEKGGRELRLREFPLYAEALGVPESVLLLRIRKLAERS